jgi:hypothetical protein
MRQLTAPEPHEHGWLKVGDDRTDAAGNAAKLARSVALVR